MPAALKAAIDHRRRQTPPAPPLELHSTRVGRGDLRVVRPLDSHAAEPRVALVLSVDCEHEFADVLLVHTATELACEVDGIVPSERSFAGYDVVVQTDLRGAMWTWQVGKALGHLDEQVLRGLGLVASGEHSGIGLASLPSGVRVGPKLAGPADPRWTFKQTEGKSLRQLSQDCTEALLDEGMTWMVDPRLLRPELLAFAEDQHALIDELIHWTRTRLLSMSPEDVKHLLEVGALGMDGWTALGDLGADIWIALQTLIESAATGSTSTVAQAQSWRLVTATHLQPSNRTPEPEFVHHLGRKDAVPA